MAAAAGAQCTHASVLKVDAMVAGALGAPPPSAGAPRRVRTCVGEVTVSGGLGAARRPVLLTLPDIGLTHVACFGALYLCASAAAEGAPRSPSALASGFHTLHVDLPGHLQDADARGPPSGRPLPDRFFVRA